MEGSSMPLMRKSQLLLDDFRQPYPPDLLAFPPRNLQPSPAGSSASTVADTSRLPPHHGPQSPLHSPLYEHLYRTLPISRSQSPFVGPVPPRMPRLGQGYVTIPRRPRQSWSSEPPLSDIGEPLYDNLGARTSINGNFLHVGNDFFYVGWIKSFYFSIFTVKYYLLKWVLFPFIHIFLLKNILINFV